jgi:hypothetical protein
LFHRGNALARSQTQGEEYMKQRVYTIGVGDQVRLIRASNRRQAIAHVSLGIMTIRVATQEDIITQLDKGVPIENYTAPEQIELDI